MKKFLVVSSFFYSGLAFCWNDVTELVPPVLKQANDKLNSQSLEKTFSSINGIKSPPSKEVLLALAEKGYPHAQFSLASMLLKSNQPKERKEGYRWMYFAAHSDNWQAQLVVSKMYLNGVYAQKDFGQALRWFEKAAHGVDQYEEKRRLIRFANHQMEKLAKNGTDKQFEQFMAILAKLGDSKMQFHLAERYWQKRSQSQHRQSAISWYQQAADQGLEKARLHLVINLLSDPDSEKKEREMAMELLPLVQLPKDGDLAYKLSVILADEGLDTLSMNYLELAAEEGSAYAQYRLGVLYASGEEQKYEKDLKLAHSWFEKAAQKGYDKAAHRLALSYLHGYNGKKSIEDARYWLTEASNQGNQQAQELLNQVSTKKSWRKALKKQEMKSLVHKSAQLNNGSPDYVAVEGLDWAKGLVGKKGYTLQLLVAENQDTVVNFLESYKISESFLHLVENAQKGKEKHVIIHGEFDDYKTAYNRAVEISQGFDGFKPWIRSLDSLKQKELKKLKILM